MWVINDELSISLGATAMKIRRLLFASAAVFAMSVLATAANAITVSIGFQQAGVSGGAITTVATGNDTLIGNVFPGTYGTFTFNGVTASGSPPNSFGDLLNSTAQNISSVQGGTLNVWVTAQDNLSPSGNLTFISSLTSNGLPEGWTVTMTTYLDPGNSLWGNTTLLSSNVFTGVGTFIDSASANAGAGPYSITQLYTIVATGAGTALSTMNVSAVPGPMVGAGLPGLLLAAGGLLALARRRRMVAI